MSTHDSSIAYPSRVRVVARAAIFLFSLLLLGLALSGVTPAAIFSANHWMALYAFNVGVWGERLLGVNA